MGVATDQLHPGKTKGYQANPEQTLPPQLIHLISLRHKKKRNKEPKIP